MATFEYDAVLLDPTRLTIVSLLAGVEWAEFGWLREEAGVSASALSKQVSTLEAKGYVEVKKGYVGKRPRTWVSLGEAGRGALENHVAALQQVVEASRRRADEADT
ncbi:winged helix-turn-helix domain-containing protein [Streptomyces sp. NPDC002795]|uniref:winged helix-turn-helix domain-containing protein n=1 Tax=Streptomyces sp. NPDC002795 TaxID=3364665 RepID=UPI0036B6E167